MPKPNATNSPVSVFLELMLTTKVVEARSAEISDEEVEAKWTELKTAWQNKKYIRDRSGRTHEVTDNLYPYWGEQFDLLWHCIDADSELKTKFASFYNALKTVKDAHPKP